MGKLVLTVDVAGRHEYELDEGSNVICDQNGENRNKAFTVNVKYRNDDEYNRDDFIFIGNVIGTIAEDGYEFYRTLIDEGDELCELADLVTAASRSELKEEYANKHCCSESVITIDGIFLPHTYEGINVLDSVFSRIPSILVNDICMVNECCGLFASARDDIMCPKDGYSKEECEIATKEVHDALLRNNFLKISGNNFAYDWDEARKKPSKWTSPTDDNRIY